MFSLPLRSLILAARPSIIAALTLLMSVHPAAAQRVITETAQRQRVQREAVKEAPAQTVPAQRIPAQRIPSQRVPVRRPAATDRGPDVGGRASLLRAEPATPAEQRFIDAFAQKIRFVTAQIAANPNVNHAPGSLEAKLKNAYLRAPFRDRSGMQQRAQALLAKPAAEQQKYFGDLATESTPRSIRPTRGLRPSFGVRPAFGVRPDRSTSTLDPELQAMLRSAVRARVNHEEIQKQVELAIERQFPESWVKVVEGLHKEMHKPPAQWIHISRPRSLDFVWGTKTADAEECSWKLVGPGPESKPQQRLSPKLQAVDSSTLAVTSNVLATGTAGDAPGGFFNIDFKQFLPPNPPVIPTMYRVYVQPRTKMKTAPGATPNSASKIPGKPVGDWSPAACVFYGLEFSGPTTVFETREIYQQSRFVLESIKMIQDQSGPGNEEFHIRGFVQEFSSGGGVQARFHEQAELDPSGLDPDDEKYPTKTFNRNCGNFTIGAPAIPSTPRTYIALLSVMEEDDGGALADWQSEISKIAEDLIRPEVTEEVAKLLADYRDLIEDELEKALDEYQDEMIEMAIQLANTIADVVVAIVANASSAFVVGSVVAVAAAIIAAVIADSDDDFYAPLHVSSFFSLTLPTNDVRYIESLSGQKLSDGTYRLKTLSKRYYGIPGHHYAGSFDGIVDLQVRWEFFDKMSELE